MTPRFLRARQERGDLGETDFYPTAVSSKRTHWKARTVKLLKFGRAAINRVNKKSTIKYKCGDTCHSDMLEWLQEFRGNLEDNRVLERRDSHVSSSHELSSERTPARSVEVCKHSVYTDFPKAEIARSVRGPKRRGLVAEDGLAEPYVVMKIMVMWLQLIRKFSVTIANLETIIDMQSFCRIWPPNGSNHFRAKRKLFKELNEAC